MKIDIMRNRTHKGTQLNAILALKIILVVQFINGVHRKVEHVFAEDNLVAVFIAQHDFDYVLAQGLKVNEKQIIVCVMKIGPIIVFDNRIGIQNF